MNPKNIIIISILLILTISAGVFLLFRSDPKPNDSSTDINTPFTAEQVKQHASRSDCWTIIENNVYNITSYVSGHPGGTNILSACGIDATSYFHGEQAGQAGGTNDHTNNGRAAAQLKSLQVGTIAK